MRKIMIAALVATFAQYAAIACLFATMADGMTPHFDVTIVTVAWAVATFLSYSGLFAYTTKWHRNGRIAA